ncbi:MAG: hypothetical protein HY340_02915 [Candidatus Kerfeldbacteria bacterium]|nr:hypothetical protein [Candidatus Kerfeldbacteria bacterium]
MKTELTFDRFRWVSIVKPDSADATYLRDACGFLPSHVESSMVASQRSRLLRGPGYVFLAMLFPAYDRGRRTIKPFEIDLFLSSDRIVTVQDRSGPIVQELTVAAEDGQLRPDGPVEFLELLLDRLLTATFPMIDHISLEVHDIERRLFAGNERMFLEELVTVRRNIAVFRKAVQAHKFIIRRVVNLLDGPSSVLPPNQPLVGFENLVEHTKEIWDALDVQKEEVETLESTNESLISYRLNEIMRKYTTISVMIFAMTLAAALFTMDVDGRPLIHLKNAFWYILILETVIAVILWNIFKRKRLL